MPIVDLTAKILFFVPCDMGCETNVPWTHHEDCSRSIVAREVDALIRRVERLMALAKEAPCTCGGITSVGGHYEECYYTKCFRALKEETD